MYDEYWRLFIQIIREKRGRIENTYTHSKLQHFAVEIARMALGLNEESYVSARGFVIFGPKRRFTCVNMPILEAHVLASAPPRGNE